MSTEEALDKIISSLESHPVEMEEFYERMSEYYPVAVGWLTDRSDPLTGDEEDYLLYLGMILLTLVANRELDDVDPPLLEEQEEHIWESLNADHPRSLEAQADKVNDDDTVGVFLIDALHSDEELPFLTPPGAIAGYARLYALAGAFGLIKTT
jgi:hypothetical protein